MKVSCLTALVSISVHSFLRIDAGRPIPIPRKVRVSERERDNSGEEKVEEREREERKVGISVMIHTPRDQEFSFFASGKSQVRIHLY